MTGSPKEGAVSIVWRELVGERGRKVTLILGWHWTGIWIETGRTGTQEGGGNRNQQEARDWFVGQLAEWAARGYTETPASLSRWEYVKPWRNGRRFWSLWVNGLERQTQWGRIRTVRLRGQKLVQPRGQASHCRNFATQAELQRSCRRLVAGRLRQGYRLVDRASYRI
jgi:predicted DNA-binding WGR domain protein